jgi:hypothetical protein
MACHHGNGPPGSWRSEYSTWAACDPHARAHAVLLEERSQRIQEILNRSEPPEKRVAAEHNALCLSCHATEGGGPCAGEKFRLTDGVGCESCHGPAEIWKSLHYRSEWPSTIALDKVKMGFVLTRDLPTRVKVCADCHVGSADREVNHDLIAAGHPRLRFEFGAYLANYPKHWVEKGPNARPDFQAWAWAVGQVATAKAAVELLRIRADEKNNKVWPEFAEYGCYGCHHKLQDREWREKEKPENRRVGSLEWGTWYTAALRPLSQGSRAGAEAVAALTEIETAMADRSPDRNKVVRLAKEAETRLTTWLGELQASHPDCGSLVALMDRVAADRDRLADQSWDSATQLYLGLAALNSALGDMDAKYRHRPEMKEAVAGLGVLLDGTFPREPGVTFDSPRNFKPGLLKKNLDAVRVYLQHGLK